MVTMVGTNNNTTTNSFIQNQCMFTITNSQRELTERITATQFTLKLPIFEHMVDNKWVHVFIYTVKLRRR